MQLAVSFLLVNPDYKLPNPILVTVNPRHQLNHSSEPVYRGLSFLTGMSLWPDTVQGWDCD